ncbi:MAG: SoxR reducing system RseC family protein [Pseudomonadota bacterium]
MIETRVRVLSARDGNLLVEPTEAGGCTACHSRDTCGISGLGRYFSGRRQPIAIACEGHVQAGEERVLAVPEGDLLRAGLLAYLLPALLAVFGAVLGEGRFAHDAGGALGALAGAALGLLLARILSRPPQLRVVQASSSIPTLNQGETP